MFIGRRNRFSGNDAIDYVRSDNLNHSYVSVILTAVFFILFRSSSLIVSVTHQEPTLYTAIVV
jgi:hypothetical protein